MPADLHRWFGIACLGLLAQWLLVSIWAFLVSVLWLPLSQWSAGAIYPYHALFDGVVGGALGLATSIVLVRLLPRQPLLRWLVFSLCFLVALEGPLLLEREVDFMGFSMFQPLLWSFLMAALVGSWLLRIKPARAP